MSSPLCSAASPKTILATATPLAAGLPEASPVKMTPEKVTPEKATWSSLPGDLQGSILGSYLSLKETSCGMAQVNRAMRAIVQEQLIAKGEILLIPQARRSSAKAIAIEDRSELVLSDLRRAQLGLLAPVAGVDPVTQKRAFAQLVSLLIRSRHLGDLSIAQVSRSSITQINGDLQLFEAIPYRVAPTSTLSERRAAIRSQIASSAKLHFINRAVVAAPLSLPPLSLPLGLDRLLGHLTELKIQKWGIADSLLRQLALATPKLTTLSLEETGTTKIEPALQLWKNLREINLKNEPLDQLTATSFADLAKLQSLTLVNCGQLSVDFLAACPDLNRLNLNGNPLTSLAREAFASLASLFTLQLARCGLDSVDFLESCPNLTTLHLHFNPIGAKLTQEAFTPCRELYSLSLVGCQVTQLPDLSSLTELSSLSIVDEAEALPEIASAHLPAQPISIYTLNPALVTALKAAGLNCVQQALRYFEN